MFLSAPIAYLRSLLRNPYWWGGLAGLVALLTAVYVLVNHIAMPRITRQDVSIRMPNVIEHPYEQARTDLEAMGLRVERIVQQYNPAYTRDAVTDQSPPPLASVKPGRYVYITVNSGQVMQVVVPDLSGLSTREAINRLLSQGLQVEKILPDSIPAANLNTVTRQAPPPGDSIAEGSAVSLWYGTGLGEDYGTVPNVTGLPVEQARDTLLALQLRSIVVGAQDTLETDGGLGDFDMPEEEPLGPIVRRQSPESGTSVRTGFEIRLYVDPETLAPPPGTPDPVEDGDGN